MRRVFALISLIAASPLAFASSSDGAIPPHYGLAFTEVGFLDLGLNVFDRFVLLSENEMVSLASFASNLAGDWSFDRDGFAVNELGHPYQGSYSFEAARSCGLGFWGSTLATAVGSLGWEYFGETQAPSTNDFITTTMGGAALGEMLHRLYLQAKDSSSPLRFAASPTGALNGLILKGHHAPPVRRVPLSFTAETGLAAAILEPSGEGGTGQANIDPFFRAEEALTYGDPFAQASLPFDYFEERIEALVSSDQYFASLSSFGSLFSLPLADEGVTKVSLGASLHYDVIMSSMAALSANAIGASAFFEHAGGVRIEGSAHINAIVLGTNDNRLLEEEDGQESATGDERNYDFDVGAGAKARLSARTAGLGIASFEGALYYLLPIGEAAISAASSDRALVFLGSLDYELPIDARASIDLGYGLYWKRALYDSGTAGLDSIQSLSACLKWRW
jgi:hypothetical protein